MNIHFVFVISVTSNPFYCYFMWFVIVVSENALPVMLQMSLCIIIWSILVVDM